MGVGRIGRVVAMYWTWMLVMRPAGRPAPGTQRGEAVPHRECPRGRTVGAQMP